MYECDRNKTLLYCSVYLAGSWDGNVCLYVGQIITLIQTENLSSYQMP